MLNTLSLNIESLAFGAGMVLVLGVLGYGVIRILLPQDGSGILLAPGVGLALLALGFQWLTFVVRPSIAAVVVFCVLAPISGFVVIRLSRDSPVAWGEVAGAAGIAAAYFVALSQIVTRRGVLTLGSFPGDNIFIYTPAAEYLRNHASPLGPFGTSVSDPGSWYLVTVGPSFPNSVGPLDAAVSALTTLPVHAVFDLISAVGLAITIGPTWFFLRSNLNAAPWVAAAGCALLATNQLLYWIIGLGLQQECLSLPIFTTALCSVASALRTGSMRAAMLAGLLGAGLVGMYLPMCGLLILCTAAASLVRIFTKPAFTWRSLIRLAGAATAVGVPASLASLYVLFFRGGLGVWQLVVGARYAASAVSRFPSFQYVLGTAPFAHVWELFPLPLGHLETVALPLLVVASFVLVALIVLGYAVAVVRQRATEAALLGCGLLFAGYEVAIADYPYGFVKAVGYITPLLSVFAAWGAAALGSLVPSRYRRFASLAGVAALAMVLLASVNADRDMLRLWLGSPPAIAGSDLKIASIASVVPAGSSVLIDDPTTDYGTLVKTAVIAYFLPDRPVRVYVGDMRMGTFQNQNVRPRPCAFDFVVRALPPEGDFTLTYTEPVTGLNVYRRIGPACAAG